jgi:hypothetical protein
VCYIPSEFVGNDVRFHHFVWKEDVKAVDEGFLVGHDDTRLWSRVVQECSK